MSDVQELLEELAHDDAPRGADAVFAGAATRATRLRRVRRARRWTVAIGAAAAVVLVAVLIAQVSTSDPEHTRVGTDGGVTTTTTGSATAAQLAAGNWSDIPAAPIAPRDGASVVWTGKELVVWGGALPLGSDHVFADGAAYAPATRTWRVLPPSPLPARGNAVAVWTGNEMVIWGGYHPGVSDAVEGAAYSPDTNSWRKIATGPALQSPIATGVWTGDRMVVLGGNEGYAYDPQADAWTRLPPFPKHVLAGYEVTPIGVQVAVAAGSGRVFAFRVWEGTKHLSADTIVGTGGSDLLRYDESTNAWTLVPVAADADAGAIRNPLEAFWTGSRLLVRGDMHIPGATGPGPLPEVSAFYDPGNGAVTPLAADPLTANRSGDLRSAWTGGALWSMNSLGVATVYAPGSDAWQVVGGRWRSCGDNAHPVWTGIGVVSYCPTATDASRPFGGFDYVPG